MSDDVRRSVGLIFEETVACPEAPGFCAELPTLEDGWSGREMPSLLRWWFINTFLSPAEASRIYQAEQEIARFFIDVERLTGKPIPRHAVEELQRRVVLAMHPSGFEICTGATTHPASVASERLRARYTEASWRKKY